MNTLVNDFNRDIVVDRLHDGTTEVISTYVTAAIDKGITRIKRNVLVNSLIQQLFSIALTNSSVVAVGEQLVIDTVVCRFTINYNGLNNTTIEIAGNDELSAPITIVTKSTGFTVNGNNFEMQSLIVMVTSLLLKNSQDSGGQVVEVFAQS